MALVEEEGTAVIIRAQERRHRFSVHQKITATAQLSFFGFCKILLLGLVVFSSRIFLDFGTVAFSLLFDN